MNKYIITVVCLLISPPLFAAEDWRELCGSLGELAEAVMSGRQSGMPMANAINTAPDNAYRDMFEKLVIAAYTKPRYSTEGMQKRSVEEFRDEIYLGCAKSMIKNK